jgi:hypothetical protein
MMKSKPSIRSVAAFGCMLALGAWLGCVSEGKKARPVTSPDAKGAPIDEINLLAAPAALNFGQTAGPVGFAVKVYASNHKEPKPVPIESGKIDILMFDGSPGLAGDSLAKPLRVWSFGAADLKRFEIRTSIGVGYQLAPLWGEARPTGDKLTIVVRYTSGQGTSVTSAPSIIAVGVR